MRGTKDILADTLKAQLSTRVLEKITVTSIVDQCEVNRQTFYYHFEDINDLAKYLYKRDLQKVISENRNYNNWRDGCLATMKYIEENKDMVLNNLESLDIKRIEGALNSGADFIMTEVVDDVAEDMSVDKEDKAFIVRFYRIIFIGIISDWLEQGMKDPPELVINKLTKVIQGNIRMALERFEKKE